MHIPTEIWRADGVGIEKRGNCSEDAQTYAALNNHINILSKGWEKKVLMRNLMSCYYYV